MNVKIKKLHTYIKKKAIHVLIREELCPDLLIQNHVECVIYDKQRAVYHTNTKKKRIFYTPTTIIDSADDPHFY